MTGLPIVERKLLLIDQFRATYLIQILLNLPGPFYLLVLDCPKSLRIPRDDTIIPFSSNQLKPYELMSVGIGAYGSPIAPGGHSPMVAAQLEALGYYADDAVSSVQIEHVLNHVPEGAKYPPGQLCSTMIIVPEDEPVTGDWHCVVIAAAGNLGVDLTEERLNTLAGPLEQMLLAGPATPADVPA